MTLLVVVHTVPYVVFRLALFLMTVDRAETEGGTGEGGKRERKVLASRREGHVRWQDVGL